MITRSLSARPRLQERGQILPLVGIMLVVIISFAALAVDVGTWRYQQRIEQSAADSAAIAGASEEAFPPSSVKAAATKDATSNGFTDNGGSVRVIVNTPPATGPNAANSSAVEVLISGKQPLFFANVIPGFLSPTVTVRAVAVTNTSLINCVIALHGVNTLNGGGRGSIQAPSCGVITNTNLTNNGQPNINARSIGYVGTYKGFTSGYPEGQPMNSVAVVDPCSTIPGCSYLWNLTANSPGLIDTGICQDAPGVVLNLNNLKPGEYCYAHNWSNFTLVPGPPPSGALFVFDKGLPPGNGSGTGVTIYNGTPSGSGGGLTWNGTGVRNFTAPAAGSAYDTAGMAFFQPASDTGSITIDGASGSIGFAGGFYAPGAAVTFNGNLPSITYFVSSSITINGGGLTAAGLGSGTTGHAVLAE